MIVRLPFGLFTAFLQRACKGFALLKRGWGSGRRIINNPGWAGPDGTNVVKLVSKQYSKQVKAALPAQGQLCTF